MDVHNAKLSETLLRMSSELGLLDDAMSHIESSFAALIEQKAIANDSASRSNLQRIDLVRQVLTEVSSLAIRLSDIEDLKIDFDAAPALADVRLIDVRRRLEEGAGLQANKIDTEIF